MADTNLRLFNRNVEITLITQPTPTAATTASTNPGYFDTSQSANAIVITDLRVQFDVKKNLGKQPNSCVLTITNLAKETRGRLERKPLYAIVKAGHDGVLRPLFQGSVSYAKSELKSPNWETKIQIADGGRAYASARLSRSYAPPINPYRVIQDAAASMGLQVPPDLASADELRQALSGGLTAHAPTRDILTRMLAPYGYSWSIQDGRLQILKSGVPNANTAWVIDVEAGMIGSPEGSVPHKPGAVSELSIDVLLYPEIGPGDTIQVNSRAYNGGFFRVNDIQHKGDSRGNEWTSSIKATPLGSPPPRGRGKK